MNLFIINCNRADFKINKKDLISIIQNTQTFIEPKIKLEQYTIDATCAVDLIFFAGFEFNDIKNKLIFDLGAGTGRLSIASALMKANCILSIDKDWKALCILKNNIKNLDLEHIIFPICAEVKYLEISKLFMPKNLKITTIMNPPFGVQNKTADRIFLEKAFSFSDVIYSIHLASEKVHKFILNYIKKFNWKVDNVIPFNMILEKSFKFHTQKIKKIDVNLYRFLKQ
ncbi:MAG: DNA methylase [Promethearchaeota archaeon]|nr:MAG: DNA methylase [Candidatus Lokiarchaeota archaeon]